MAAGGSNAIPAGPTRPTCRAWSPGSSAGTRRATRVQRPDLRARRRRLELRLPARRPEQPPEIVGHSAGPRKDAALVRPPSRRWSSRYPTSRCSIRTAAAVRQREDRRDAHASASSGRCRGRGCPCDNAVDRSTNKILKAELVYRETFGTTRGCCRSSWRTTCIGTTTGMHSTLGYIFGRVQKKQA